MVEPSELTQPPNQKRNVVEVGGIGRENVADVVGALVTTKRITFKCNLLNFLSAINFARNHFKLAKNKKAL